MSSISTTYNPQAAEEKWYAYWLQHKFFASKPNPAKKPYSVVIPPPNVTGVLHMGHMLNNTIQDVLVRRARMRGYEACWVPGTDHASIATEARVVAMLKEQGINKTDLTRDEFLTHAWAWKEKYGGIILKQLEKLGCSLDWDRTRFTMEPDMTQAVIDVFVDLYKKGHIYRGVRMVNWDPQGLTAVSDEEVYHKEVNSKLYYCNYEFADGSGHLTVATTRPETILADVAIAVNPTDERYKTIVGKQVKVPFAGRLIPVIADDYVATDFGTGCLKVTPAHDINDYEIGLRHKLQVIDILTDTGHINQHGGAYEGMDRFAARKKFAADLKEAGLLEKEEDVKNNVGYSERTNAVIEPRLSLQWFLKMEELSKPALEHVMNDDIQLVPPKFKNMYRSWMENVRDWCISRQLWWGQRIPAYYMPGGDFVVASSLEQALAEAQKTNPAITTADLKQDEDVLDTWFSSWLWPISVFDGFKNPGNPDIEYYYPTTDLVTAPEILFFWVARMVIAGYEYRKDKPFSNVYLTGIVRDKLGRKMSKSLGNSPDPLDLIAKYGADGVRTGMLFSSPAGNDLPFDEKLCEQGRNFSNKIWNAYRLVAMWPTQDGLYTEDNQQAEAPAENLLAIKWFKSRFAQQLTVIEEHYAKYRISDALLATYNLVWTDFCAWYLEMVKPPFGEAIDSTTKKATIQIFGNLLKVLHPFMPFISEEIWQLLEERPEGSSICIEAWPEAGEVDEMILQQFSSFTTLITEVRNLRNARQLSPKTPLQLIVKTADEGSYAGLNPLIAKLANMDAISFGSEAPASAISLVIKADEFFIPLAGNTDAAKEKEDMLKELEYNRGFLESVNKKLGNEKFVANAKPDVLERERQKQADALNKINAIEAALKSLGATA